MRGNGTFQKLVLRACALWKALRCSPAVFHYFSSFSTSCACLIHPAIGKIIQFKNEAFFGQYSLCYHRIGMWGLLWASELSCPRPQCPQNAARRPRCYGQASSTIGVGAVELSADHRHPRLAWRVCDLLLDDLHSPLIWDRHIKE